MLHEARFVDLSPGEVFAILLDEGRYLCSESTMYRLLRQTHGDIRERRRHAVHPAKVKPELVAHGSNQCWSWDITKLHGPAKWTCYYLYSIIDIYFRYTVGWMLATRESKELAERLLADTIANPEQRNFPGCSRVLVQEQDRLEDTMRITSAVPAVLALALLVGLPGCSDDSAKDADPTVAAAPSTTDAPTKPPTPTSTAIPEARVPPFTADTRPSYGGQGSGNGLGVIGVRTARHHSYDRVVFDLGGTGTLGWAVEYTTGPRYEGPGDPVRLKGSAVLMVFLNGLGLPFDTGLARYSDITTRLPGTDTEAIAEIAPGGVVEGSQQAFIGLTGAKRPCRVFALANPTRLVVDVAHS